MTLTFACFRGTFDRFRERTIPFVNFPATGMQNRGGGIVLILALLLVGVIACIALSIDLAYVRLARSELRNAADSAALASAGVLRNTKSVDQARSTAVQYALYNRAAGSPVQLDANADVIFGQRVYNSTTQKWDFVANQQPYDSVKVQARRTVGSPGGPVGLFFGRSLGKDYIATAGSAVATYLPRDIAIVIDLSGSMLYDSTLLREGTTTINNQAVWQALGSRTFGTMTNWNTLQTISSSTSTASVISQLGLTNVVYPYPGGSWSEFVSYAKGSDAKLPISYRNKYGLKTWIDYTLQKRSYKTSTPLLSTTPEQPITALKQAVTIMLNYLDGLDTDEWVSLSTFDTNARIELNLTTDLTSVNTSMQDKQAGHYLRETNIGGGIYNGRQTLTGSTARAGAKKVMIVFSDGVATDPGTNSQARQYAVNQATAAAAEDIVIHTISFSSLADYDLMAQIAAIGHGMHFHVESSSVTVYTQQLQDVILNVSSIRPLALTK